MRHRRMLKLLSRLLPAGALGVSVTLAAASSDAMSRTGPETGSTSVEPADVAARLASIRHAVSSVTADATGIEPGDPNIIKAWWGNWRGGGWRGGWGGPRWGNGGWRNGGWGNGGWGNGGWHNFWHNW